MHQTVDPLINPDEQTKVSNILDLSFNGGPHGVFFSNDIPWIWHHLFHAQRYPPVLSRDT